MAGLAEREFTQDASGADLLAGESPVRSLMRRCDWSATPLGPPASWPQSLRAIVRVMLTSRFAMWMAWGPELTFLCNDAYLPTVGIKREWVIGSRSDKVWEEIWPDIGPRIAHVLESGEATWDEGLLLYLERSGFSEETYHTFSYSPLADNDGVTRGMLCVVAEETERVIGERQLATLRELGARLAAASTRTQVTAALQDCLLTASQDLPFALAYFADDEKRSAELAAFHGLAPGHPLAPAVIGLDQSTSPFGRLDPRRAVEAAFDPALVSDLPLGSLQKPPSRVLISPIRSAEGAPAVGYFVAGLNPHRTLDGNYRGFIELLTAQLAAAVARTDEYERERERAKALAEIDKAKTAFFSNVSHEFRTPLTLMLGPLQDALAEGDELPPRQRERIDVAHRNALRLLRLVNALLDFSRIEAGRVLARRQPTDLAALTGELAASFRSATERAGLKLIVDAPPLSRLVNVDRDLWEKIVLNLLSNAFKFTFDGEIAVTVSERDGRALLVVRDTGIGIAKQELPKLFERFHRVEGARGRSFEGSGIGLALVQELVKLHGGEVAVESEVGRGAAFTVTLPFGSDESSGEPLAADSWEPGAARAFVEEALRWLPDEASREAMLDAGPPEPLRDAGARPRVLLADDNADLRGYIARLLGERGYETTVTGDGEAALAAARASRPDIVVTDVMMPKLDGVGLLRALRADPALRDLPVIMLSARAGEEAKIEGLDAGADDYLTKPFSARELIARVGSNVAMARLRREAAAAVRASEARARLEADRVQLALDAGAIVGVWERDLRANRSVGDERFARAFGFDAERLRAGVRLEDLLARIHEGDRARVAREIDATLHRGQRYRSEYRVLQADGGYRWFEAVGRVERDENGEPAKVLGLLIDIDHRRHAEEELRCLNEELEARIERAIAARETAEAALRQSQKMEAVGQLTGGVAHDFNNLLTIISGNIDMALRAIDKGAATRAAQALAHAQKGAERAASLTQRLLAFSRRQPLTPKPLDVAQLTAGMSELLKRALGETVALHIRAAPGLWRVEADPNQLENAILNLAVNARDAMPDGGELTIEAANQSFAAPLGEAGPGDYVVIAVTDTGLGMDAATVARAFDPFFTTKEVGKGTGLGLSMVYGFVRQSGGHVEIRSKPGEGASVRICLPRLVGGEPEEAAAPEACAQPAKVPHAVLVVEDDADVRAYTVEIVRELGYRVYEAPDGPSALKLLDGGAARVDILFTDVVMPGMSGRELAARARAMQPDLKVLLTSGYTGVFNGQNEPWANGVELIAKPFTYEGLARRIAELVEAG